MAFDSRPVVMKFGGTSVADADAIRRLLESVRVSTAAGVPTLVVVSAMAGVTDRLLALASAAERRDTGAAIRGLEQLLTRHESAVGQLVNNLSPLWPDIVAHFNELGTLLEAAAILRSASPAARDAIASVGELASSRMVAAALDDAGIETTWVDALARS